MERKGQTINDNKSTLSVAVLMLRIRHQ